MEQVKLVTQGTNCGPETSRFSNSSDINTELLKKQMPQKRMCQTHAVTGRTKLGSSLSVEMHHVNDTYSLDTGSDFLLLFRHLVASQKANRHLVTSEAPAGSGRLRSCRRKKEIRTTAKSTREQIVLKFDAGNVCLAIKKFQPAGTSSGSRCGARFVGQ